MPRPRLRFPARHKYGHGHGLKSLKESRKAVDLTD
jgi:hypothetical protein